MSRLIDKSGAPVEYAVDLLPYTPTVKLTKSANQQITPANAFVTLTWDQETFDTDGFHDTVVNNDRIVCQRSGLYILEATVFFDATNSGDKHARLLLNGAVPLDTAGESNNTSTSSAKKLTATVQLAVGDYIQVQAINNVVGFVLGGASTESAYGGSPTTTHVSMTYLGAMVLPVRQKPVVWQGTPSAMPAGPFMRYDVLELTMDNPYGSGTKVVWEFVYRDELDPTYPWHFKGGPPIEGSFLGALAFSSAGWTRMGTIPLGGRPGVYFGKGWVKYTNGGVAANISALINPDANNALRNGNNASTRGVPNGAQDTLNTELTVLSNGTSVDLDATSDSSTAASRIAGRMSVIPVKIG